MPLSWNEIRDRALNFSRDWEGETNEKAEAKSFWDSFFLVFGLTRRRLASFETPVKKGDGHGGYVDLLWKGVLLVEHKSAGKDLDRAYGQALDYFPGLAERDLPRYVVVSDFKRFRLYDLDLESQHEFQLADFHRNVNHFAFIAGYKTKTFGDESPVNIKAARLLGALHDELAASGYVGHSLERFLVRTLFCLFAEDTGIFERRSFQDYLEVRTNTDGSDVGMHLAHLYEILNRPNAQRQNTLDEELASFPYINGSLFEDSLPIPSFNRRMREVLLDCCAVDWSEISPAIFGSLFQSIMDPAARRHLGAHYTSENNIKKLIGPLFLDELHAELEAIGKLKRRKKEKLSEFQEKLRRIRILDPACGCGNFLVVAYKELRLLELEVIRGLQRGQINLSSNLEGFGVVIVDVDQFYGIEIEDFAAQIAQVALWLTDHQMNLKVSEEFGQYFVRLPLKCGPTIVLGNALETDWNEVVSPQELSYIIGNPPFSGKKEQSTRQKLDIARIWGNWQGAGVLDYVTCWFRKAVDYLDEHSSVEVGFVSTNSITQGEQVAPLWNYVLSSGMVIKFAHQTFKWTSEAPGKAAVHCVITGLTWERSCTKKLYHYESPSSEPYITAVDRINPYLVEGPDVLVTKSTTNICNHAPPMVYGSMPIDNGNLILTQEEMEMLIVQEPQISPFVKKYGGGKEAISDSWRYCLWLRDCPPSTLRQMPIVMDRIRNNQKYRASRSRVQTQKLAKHPALFGEIRQPNGPYLLIPKVSSVGRKYIPISFLGPDVIANGSSLIIPDASVYEFGIVQSQMHMVWVRHIGGAMKSDLQYSVQIVYNNFVWPGVSSKTKAAISQAAESVLHVRERYHESSLEDLYDPICMPASLVNAHQKLDRLVDRAYRRSQFKSDSERLALLLELYSEASQTSSSA